MAVDNNETMKATTAVEQTTPAPAAGAQPNIFVRAWRAITHFLREVQVELKKTNWPSKNELTKFTIVVIITIVVVAVFLFAGDFIIANIAHYLFSGGSASSGLPVGR